MSRTVTAMYDSRQEAEDAKSRLSAAVDTQSVRIIDQSSDSDSSTSSSSSSGGGSSGGGGWLSNLFVSDDDRQTYSEGVNRGSFMLYAEIDSEEDADRVVSILEETSCVDVDERSQGWRNEGWQPQARSTAGTTGAFATGQSTDYENRQNVTGTGDRTIEEERIPIVEETLRVGKRETERGSARVRSYVREEPVSEQVNLREEHISVERRPVTEAGTLTQADLNRGELLQDREIEMRATAEEAVAAKEAHVTEEVILRKTAEEHTENVSDTVRHTEVDVDEDAGTRGSAFGFRDTDGTQQGQRDPASTFERDDSNR